MSKFYVCHNLFKRQHFVFCEEDAVISEIRNTSMQALIVHKGQIPPAQTKYSHWLLEKSICIQIKLYMQSVIWFLLLTLFRLWDNINIYSPTIFSTTVRVRFIFRTCLYNLLISVIFILFETLNRWRYQSNYYVTGPALLPTELQFRFYIPCKIALLNKTIYIRKRSVRIRYNN